MNGGISSSKQVSRVCAAQHLPNVSNSARMIGIRNIASLQTQKYKDIQSTRLRDRKKQKGEALAGTLPGGRLDSPQHFLSILLAGSWRDCLPCSPPLPTLQDDPVNTKPSTVAPQLQGCSFRSHAR